MRRIGRRRLASGAPVPPFHVRRFGAVARGGSRCLRRALHRLGLDVSRHPVRHRDDAAVYDGRRPLPDCRGDPLHLGAEAEQGGAHRPPVADGGRRRGISAPRRQRRRDVGRAADSVRHRRPPRGLDADVDGGPRRPPAGRDAAGLGRRPRARGGPGRDRPPRGPERARRGARRRPRRSRGGRRGAELGRRVDLPARGAQGGGHASQCGDADAGGRRAPARGGGPPGRAAGRGDGLGTVGPRARLPRLCRRARRLLGLRLAAEGVDGPRRRRPTRTSTPSSPCSSGGDWQASPSARACWRRRRPSSWPSRSSRRPGPPLSGPPPRRRARPAPPARPSAPRRRRGGR